METTVYTADAMQWCKDFTGQRYNAVLCDPPYEIGFQHHAWDKSGIAYSSNFWQALAGVLQPGAFIMAFAAPRVYHRVAVAMEAAGLVLHPPQAWLFGSGFPHATRVQAHGWENHRYGLSAIKPAMEMIAVGQVPYGDVAAHCIADNRAGAWNISASGDRWPCALTVHEDAAHALDMQAGVAASAYFQASDAFYERMEQAAPGYYAPKPTGRERDAGCEAHETAILRRANPGGAYEHDPAWAPRQAKNVHPTVKPIRLTRYLADLLLPPDTAPAQLPMQPPDVARQRFPRRILVPFAGSGSEMIGALLAGWDVVHGIEQDANYAEIARSRLEYWHTKNNEKPPLYALFDEQK